MKQSSRMEIKSDDVLYSTFRGTRQWSSEVSSNLIEIKRIRVFSSYLSKKISTFSQLHWKPVENRSTMLFELPKLNEMTALTAPTQAVIKNLIPTERLVGMVAVVKMLLSNEWFNCQTFETWLKCWNFIKLFLMDLRLHMVLNTRRHKQSQSAFNTASLNQLGEFCSWLCWSFWFQI